MTNKNYLSGNNCVTCKYRGFVPDDTEHNIRYLGERCTNTGCIFYKSMTEALINGGLTVCKKWEGST